MFLKEITIITLLFHGIKFVMYYAHERVWMKVKWGRVTHPLELLPPHRKLAPEHVAIIKKQFEGWGYIEIENKKNDNKPRRNTPKALSLEVRLEKETVDEFT